MRTQVSAAQVGVDGGRGRTLQLTGSALLLLLLSEGVLQPADLLLVFGSRALPVLQLGAHSAQVRLQGGELALALSRGRLHGVSQDDDLRQEHNPGEPTERDLIKRSGVLAEAAPPPGLRRAPPWCCRWCSPSAPSAPPCQPAASQAELHHIMKRLDPGLIRRTVFLKPDSEASTHSAGTGSVWSTLPSTWSYSSSPPPAELHKVNQSPNVTRSD